MRRSELLVGPAARVPNENHDRLLEYAGYVHELSDGLYSLLPLAQRVLQRMSEIVRRELARAGAQEVVMPLLQPLPLWEQMSLNGLTRAEAMRHELFTLSGLAGRRMILAPTHEEVAAVIAAACIKDGTQVPRMMFQIQPRFRDYVGPFDASLLRTREFVMMDAYTFDAERQGLDARYEVLRGGPI